MLFSAVMLGSLARPILSMPHELGTCQEFHKVSTIIFACGDEFTEYVDIFGWALQNPLNSNHKQTAGIRLHSLPAVTPIICSE